MTKTNDKTDLRIRRTRIAIRESFFSLLEEKDFEKISVKDLTDRAMISRNTFYLHYNDKYELLDHICDELVNSLFKKVKSRIEEIKKQSFTAENVATVIKEGILAVSEDREEYAILLKGSASDVLTAKLHKMISEVFKTVSDNLGGVDGCSTEYIISGMTGVIKYYVNHDVENIENESRIFTLVHLGSIIDIANRGINANEK